jgi:hypothetical protein
MPKPVSVSNAEDYAFRYSICSFVTKPAQYEGLVKSLSEHGFGFDDCEYLYIDNSKKNVFEAYRGINKFLEIARGKHVILVHQDVLLLSDGREKLDRLLAELDRVDPGWGLCGNAGGIAPGQVAIRISDPHGENQRSETFPERVFSLDENFIVVRKDANLALSRDLSGFHLYGAELCLIADMLGHSAYVIDFHLRHLSAGVKDPTFDQIRLAMVEKYSRALRPRLIKTTTTILVLRRGASRLGLNSKLFIRGLERAGAFIRMRKGKRPKAVRANPSA